MKNLKIAFLLLIVATFSNCNDDDPITVALDFNIENLSGNYGINSFNANLTNSAITQGTSVIISTATKTGGIFQIDLTLNSNGTYTAIGDYSVETIVTPVSGSQTIDQEIINVNNEGTFTISATGSRTITFNATSGTFLNGEYSVNLFDDDTLTIIQDKSENTGGITTQTLTNIIFQRD